MGTPADARTVPVFGVVYGAYIFFSFVVVDEMALVYWTVEVKE